MSFLSKVELKKQLRDMGIKVEGNYVRKTDLEKIVAASKSTIDKVREIIENQQYAKINGVMVDYTTANAIITVYNQLNERDKIEFAKLPIKKMAMTAWQMVRPAK